MTDMDLGSTRLIVETCQRHGLTVEQAAYVLGTARWETAQTMMPVRETLADTDEEAIRRLDNAWARGQLPWVSSPYWRDGWFGRGFVQLTHRANYAKAGQYLGEDLLGNPSLALNPSIAAEIIVQGMMGGWFTGHALPDYVNDKKADFREARRVVNGMDKADTIAALAMEYEAALLAEGYAGEERRPGSPIADNRPVLRMGSKGVFVQALQLRLADLDYHAGRADGVFGGATDASVRAFQATEGLDVDGIVGPFTWRALDDADPRPARDIGLADLRDAGDGDVRTADQGQIAAIVATVGGLATQAGDVIAEGQTLLDGVLGAVGDRWPAILAIAVAGAAAWWIMAKIKAGKLDRARRWMDMGQS